jgi:hypothetical protein
LCRIDGRETEAGISGLRQIVAQGYQIGNFIKTTVEVLNLVGRRDEANQVNKVLAEIIT